VVQIHENCCKLFLILKNFLRTNYVGANIAVFNCMEYRPNPQPLKSKGRGAKFKASLLKGERFGERSKLY
jgi:hypothetical protein